MSQPSSLPCPTLFHFSTLPCLRLPRSQQLSQLLSLSLHPLLSPLLSLLQCPPLSLPLAQLLSFLQRQPAHLAPLSLVRLSLHGSRSSLFAVSLSRRSPLPRSALLALLRGLLTLTVPTPTCHSLPARPGLIAPPRNQRPGEPLFSAPVPTTPMIPECQLRTELHYMTVPVFLVPWLA